MSAHRFFSASKAHAWLDCTASAVVDVSGVADTPGPAAARGTWLHEVSEETIRRAVPIPPTLSQEARASIEPYVRYIRERAAETPFGSGLELEMEADIDFTAELCGGTADAILIYPEPGMLEIVDLKTGGYPVDPEDNPQLIIYGLAMLDHYRGREYEFTTVRTTIVQPALDEPVRSHDYTVSEMERWRDKIVSTICDIMDGVVRYTPSEEACKFCLVKKLPNGCPARNAIAERTARSAFGDVLKIQETGEVPADSPSLSMTLSEKMGLVKVLLAWCKATAAEVNAKVLDPNGPGVEGWKAVTGRAGNRQWGEGREGAAFQLLRELGASPDDLTAVSFISPTQAEKLLQAVIEDELDQKAALESLQKLIRAGAQGKPTVVPESDKRPAITRSDLALKAFADVLKPGTPGKK